MTRGKLLTLVNSKSSNFFSKMLQLIHVFTKIQKRQEEARAQE